MATWPECVHANEMEWQVYISTLEGERLKLQAVSCYVYLGLLIQCNLRCVQLLKTLRKRSNQRTWTLIQLAAKHNLRIPQTLIMWKSLVFNATKHLLIFCPVEANYRTYKKTWLKQSSAGSTNCRDTQRPAIWAGNTSHASSCSPGVPSTPAS